MGFNIGIGWYAGIALILIIAVLVLTGHCAFDVQPHLGVH